MVVSEENMYKNTRFQQGNEGKERGEKTPLKAPSPPGNN
jgi:hypothetical protein